MLQNFFQRTDVTADKENEMTNFNTAKINYLKFYKHLPMVIYYLSLKICAVIQLIIKRFKAVTTKLVIKSLNCTTHD